MFKFIHAADLHLDSPLRGLEQYENAPVDRIRDACRRALERLVQLAIDERVNFIVLAGDIFDREWPTYNTGLYFQRQMETLREAGIPVVMIAGNHDAEHRQTKRLELPPNVVRLPTDRADTYTLDDWNVKIHGQGFATMAVTDNLSLAYPDADRGCFNIGLLHTCGIGAADGHQSYAPCTVDSLQRKQYQYWALGHVHKRDPIACDVPVHFSGNLQGRHMRETGPKGCLLVTVDDRHAVKAEFRPLDVFRWERCTIDATGAEQPADILPLLSTALHRATAAADGLPLAVRVEVRGKCRAHEGLLADQQRWVNEVRGAGNSAGASDVWIEKVKFETSLPGDSLRPAEGALGELLTMLDELHADETQLSQLATELVDLKRKLPAELVEGPDALDLDSPAQLRAALDGVRQLLVQRLTTSA